jgi:hypothetical protein
MTSTPGTRTNRRPTRPTRRRNAGNGQLHELDANGDITGLVAHEHLVPIDAWEQTTPPQLCGMDFHRHPTLPWWVLHEWVWKDNPAGVSQDRNPAVRQCPLDTPIFGKAPP